MSVAVAGVVALGGTVVVMTGFSGSDGKKDVASQTPEGAASPDGSPSPQAGPTGASPSVQPTGLSSTRVPVPSGQKTYKMGLPQDPSFFPIGVWLQDPLRMRDGKTNAKWYEAMGVNLYIGSWTAPTKQQLDALPQGTYMLATQVTDLTRASDKVRGYTVKDEPDINLHPDYGGCILPPQLKKLADEVRAADPDRPIYVNFSEGFAIPDYIGGENCPWPVGTDAFRKAGSKGDWLPDYDYKSYYQWAAIPDYISVDHYVLTDQYTKPENRQISGYGRMMRRTKKFAGSKPAWAFIQATNINDGHFVGAVTGKQIEQQVWMSILNGATGIEYFCHSFNPTEEDGILLDPAIVKAITALNARVKSVAPLLNSPSMANVVKVTAPSTTHTMVKMRNGETYIFAMEGRNASIDVTFAVPGSSVTVMDENRTIPISGGSFTDHFSPYGFHIYKVNG